MKLRVTDNNKFIRLYESSELEAEQLEYSMRKRIRGWYYNPLVKRKVWDGYVKFCKNGYIPVGLWHAIYKLGEAYNYKVQIDGLDRVIDTKFDRKDFEKWAEDHFANHPKYKPRDYQIDSAVAILKYKLTTSEIATSSGKTLIAFMVYGYLKHKGMLNKNLIIVPNTTLVMQLKNDWEEYNNSTFPMNISQVYGGAKPIDPQSDVIVGTFHSLRRKSIEYYKGIDVVFVDEAHQAKTMSIKTVLDKCKDAVYKYGLSGTLLEDDSADYTTITAYLGPVVQSISPKFLFKRGFATPVSVKIIKLNYQNQEIREKLYTIRKGKQLEGAQILAIEKKIVVQSKARFDFIVDLVSNTTKNTMVLFSNVKDKYGRRLYDTVKEKTEKVCYYVDGSVSNEHRDYFKKDMESGTNKVLFASFTTFSTGISIKNLHNIVFVESYRSEIIIKQSIGRGMRLLDGKETVKIIDIVDDISWKKKDNYLLRHGKARLEFYKSYTDEIDIFQKKI